MTDLEIPEDLNHFPDDVDPADLDVAVQALRRRFATWICGEIVSALHRKGVPRERIADIAVPAAEKACHRYNAILEREAKDLARGFVGATLH